jgi:hypothetical protein
MHTFKNSSLFLSLFAPLAILVVGCGKSSLVGNFVASPSTPTQTLAAGGVTIASPANGASVSSPFTLATSAATCSSQPVTSMSYAVDSGAAVSVNSTSINAQVAATAGSHTVHVTAQGDDDATCNASVTITVPAAATTAPGGVTITSPANGASVSSPFTLKASDATCSSQTVTSMSYALDSDAATSVNGTSIDAQVTAAAGNHTVYVTAQGDDDATCNASVSLTVPAAAAAPPSSPAPPSASTSPVPSNAIVDSSIQTLANWEGNHDPGTGASSSSSGSMFMVSSPSLSGDAREFDTAFSGSGGEIYHVSFGNDTTSTNFFYDAEVYLTSSASNIANLEMDMNSVMANGDTVIYGFQCDGYSGTWDYAENDGGSPHWVHSSAACDVRKWSQETWHHIQISYSRDDSGNVTYHSVWLDGVESPINATVGSALALGWGPTLLTNFQIDGLGSGSNTVYLDNLTISRW